MKDKDLLKLLQQNGWEIKRIQGSHHVLQKDSQTEDLEKNLNCSL